MEVINKMEDINQSIIGNKRFRDNSSNINNGNNSNNNNNSNSNSKNKIKNQLIKRPVQQNNNNNNNRKNRELPVYLQKYIIKLLVNEINRKDKNHDYYKMISCEKRFKCKLLSIAMVNWDWFKTISNNLYCANDNYNYKSKQKLQFQNNLLSSNPTIALNNNYNYQLSSELKTEKNRYSLIKEENIRVLRLTQVYCKEYCKEISERINKLENLKKIILSSTFTSTDDWYLFTEYIDLQKYKIDINCDIHDIYEHTSSRLFSTPSNLNVSLLNIWSDFDEECELVALEYIKYFRPKKLLLYPTSNIIQFSKGYDLFINNSINNNNRNNRTINSNNNFNSINNNQNQNNNILSFKELYYYEPITIEELYYLIKSSPNIKSLSFEICYDTLIYYLSEKKTKPCTCNTSISVHTGDDSLFYQYWQFIHSSILNHKFLKSLSITHRCPESYELNQFYTGSYQNEISFPIEFIENFGSMILNNKSLKSLKLSGIHLPSLFEYIINGRSANNQEYDNLSQKHQQQLASKASLGNKRILKFKSEFINTLNNDKEYIESIDKILKDNPSITKFYLHEINYVGDYLKKNYLTFKCIYKSSKKK